MTKDKNIINNATNNLAPNTEKLLNDLRAQLNKIHIEHHELSQANHEKYLELITIHSSISWRLTAPVRSIAAKFNRIKAVLVRAASVVEYEGGLAKTLSKIAYLYIQGGIKNVKQDLHMISLASKAGSLVQNYANGNTNYAEWVKQYDTLTDTDRANMQATQAEFAHKPLISVVMPTYNPNPEWLIEAIESVRSQIYPNWELCIADDASTNSAIREILERYTSQDPRVKVVIRPQNGHISEASNSAVALATGSWIALLDHDDILPEHALFWVVHSINTQPGIRLIYSDEDKTDAAGRRFDPYFKSDWNIDLFYSHNMFSHLGVYETKLLKHVGGFQKGLEGSQDYDLALRCIEHVEPSQIHHIPRVLYQWRVHADSTASASSDAKPYAMVAGERALNEHFKRTGVKGAAISVGYGYHASYDLPTKLPLVSIIIPTRDGLNLLQQCVESILTKTTYSNYEILIIDNDSKDEATLSYLKVLSTSSSEHKSIRVMHDKSAFNYSRLNNTAVQQVNGEIVALLNNDIEVISPNWLNSMVSHALRAKIGAVGAKLYYPNDTIQHAGITLGVGGVAAHAHRMRAKNDLGYMGRAMLTQNYSAVSAACLVIKKAIYQQVGGLNEVELGVAYNDVDFCLRISEAGYRNVWTPDAELYHHESASRGSDETSSFNRARLQTEAGYMLKRWGDLLQHDPAYSPNLTLSGDDFSYAWPPRVPAIPTHVNANNFMPVPTPQNREGKAMFSLNDIGLGLVIGCALNPIIPKNTSYKFHVVESATTQELYKKYANDSIINNLHEVDFVWSGELSLGETICHDHGYDWIVVNHAIESVVDFVRFLQDCEGLLAPDGIISLVISDSRICFEHHRNLSSTEDVLETFFTNQADSNLRTPLKVDFQPKSRTSMQGIDWYQLNKNQTNTLKTYEDVKRNWLLSIQEQSLFELKNWTFTPDSFRVILNDIQQLGLTQLAEIGGFDSCESEFWIRLHKRTSNSVIYDRSSLSKSIALDIAK